MKKIPYLFLLIFPVLLFDCSKSDMEYENDFEKSYKSWLNFKKSNNNSYRYVVNGSSVFGPYWETSLTIRDGEVVERAFRFTSYDVVLMPSSGWDLSTAQQVIDTLTAHGAYLDETVTAEEFLKKLMWTESVDRLNSTSDTPAAAVLTLDQVYDRAKNDWLKKRDNAQAFFEAKHNGMLSSSGYWENGCVDDCFRGITISVIEGI